MPGIDRINTYIAEICEQIRWKRARIRIADEMTGHIADTRDAYIEQGMDETEAVNKAVSETGDAVEIGTQLDRIHRPRPQWGMLVITATLLIAGLLIRLFVFNELETYGSLADRLIYTVLGVAAMVATYLADYTLIGRFPKMVDFVVAVIAVVTLVLSPSRNGVSYYMNFVSLLFPLAYAAVLFSLRGRGYAGIIISGAAFIVPCVAVLLAPSISGFMHYAAVSLALLCAAIHRGWFRVRKPLGYMIILLPIVMLVLILLLNINTYRSTRLAVTFNPWLDPNGAGYIGVMTRGLLGGAKLFGTGEWPAGYIALSNGLSTYLYNNLLLAMLIYRCGWVPAACVVALPVLFIIRGFMLCFKQKGQLGFIVSLAVMGTFTVQVLTYIVYSLGFQLVSPITLPLISHGNAATVINLALIGVMLSAYRSGGIESVSGTRYKCTMVWERVFKMGRFEMTIKRHGEKSNAG